MSKNDDKILVLKTKIEEKKKALGDSRFLPITNCNLVIKEQRYNLHALREDVLKDLLIELHVKNKAIEELGIEYSLSGYQLNEWIADIKRRLEILNRAEEEKSLKLMESKLEQMLSDDKKVELELSKIEEMFK